MANYYSKHEGPNFDQLLTDLQNHLVAENPHDLTKTYFNLESVNNTSDINKPVTIALQTGLTDKEYISNKVTSFSSSSTDVQYPSTLSVKLNIQELIGIKSFSESSWIEIANLAPVANSYWSIGDTKTGTYINGETHTYRIADFKHAGDAGNITIEQVDLLNDTYYGSSSSREYTSWNNCGLIATLNKLPLDSDLDSVIKEANKPCIEHVTGSAIVNYSSRIWIMSEVEIDGSGGWCRGGSREGTQYSCYSGVKSFVKYRKGTAERWWTRSPSHYDMNRWKVWWASIIASGAVVNGWDIYSNAGIAPCFCI